MTIESLTWVGILFCLSQSAMFSGLNLAIFSLSRLRLQVESAGGNAAATRVLAIRSNSNYVLTTILWGNVSINVLLTLLTDSVLAGASAFLFSTFFITIFGEIMPQAYFPDAHPQLHSRRTLTRGAGCRLQRVHPALRLRDRREIAARMRIILVAMLVFALVELEKLVVRRYSTALGQT